MPDSAELLEHAQRFGLALAIGFMVGVERGWKQRAEPEGRRVAGVRTFALAGVLGGLSGLLAPLATGLSISIAVAFATAFVLFQLVHANDQDNSATSAIAGLTVFGLAAYAVLGDPILAVSAAVVTTALLAFKDALHGWLKALTWPEMRSALVILVATCIVLPFLPPGPVDPWRLFDLQALWLLTIVIACTSFGGYVALRLLGQRRGLAVAASIGGLVSSTAIALDLASRTRKDEISPSHAAAGVSLATATSIARVGVISALISTDLARVIWPALTAAWLVLLAGSALMMRTQPDTSLKSAFGTLRSPLEIVSVLRFVGILAVLMAASGIVVRTSGQIGLEVFGAVAGLADVDAVVLSVGKLLPEHISAQQAASVILIAVTSNQLFKLATAIVGGKPDFARRLSGLLMTAVVVGGLAHACSAFWINPVWG